MRLVVLSPSGNDLISTYLKRFGWPNVSTVTVPDFIDKGAVFDKFCGQHSEINWYFSDSHISNTSDTWLLSRLCGLSSYVFTDFAEGDKEFAIAETMAYMGFAVNQFHLVNDYACQHGGEIIYSLPEQWQFVKNWAASEGSSVTTPRYYWGDHRFCHLPDSGVVYSDIYNLTQWRPNRKPKDQRWWFCFTRPMGKPLFCATIGRQSLLTPVGHTPAPQDAQKIKVLSQKLSQYFRYFISEQLWFVEQGHLTFGMICPLLTYTAKNECIADFIDSALGELWRHDD